MRTLLLLPLLAGCPLPDDKETADTGDTANTDDTDDTDAPDDTGPAEFPEPWSWEDTDATCDGYWDASAIPGYDWGSGCGWGFVWGQTDAEAFQLTLTLPREDMLLAEDVTYDRTLGADATLEVLDRTGGAEELELWSCSDYVEVFEGTTWTATGGAVRVEARYLCDTVEPNCGFTIHEYHTMVYVRDVTLRATDGAEMSWPDQDFAVSFGWSDCGG